MFLHPVSVVSSEANLSSFKESNVKFGSSLFLPPLKSKFKSNSNSKFSSPKAFSLLEMVVTVAVLVLLVGLAVPQVMKSSTQAKLASERESMRQIESAKWKYAAANPGTPLLSVAQLAPYLPNGQLPQSSFGSFSNVTDLTKTVTSQAPDGQALGLQGVAAAAGAFNGNGKVVLARTSTSMLTGSSVKLAAPVTQLGGLSSPTNTGPTNPVTPSTFSVVVDTGTSFYTNATPVVQPPTNVIVPSHAQVVSGPPTVKLTAPSTAQVGSAVPVSAVGSDPNGYPLVYTFHGSAGDIQLSVGSTAMVFTKAGPNPVSVTVDNGNGGTATDSGVVLAYDSGFTLNLVATPVEVFRGVPIHVTGTTTGITDPQYSVTAADGSVSNKNLGKFDVVFSTIGSKTLTETASGGGHSAYGQTLVTVVDRAPTVGVTLSPTQVPLNYPVTVKVTSSDPDNDPVSISIDASGGNLASSSGNQFAYTFDAAGVKPITVTGDDGQGMKGTAATSVEVFDPKVSLQVSPITVTRNSPVHATATPAGFPSNVGITYTFSGAAANGGTASGNAFDNAYPTLGKRELQVTATQGIFTASTTTVIDVIANLAFYYNESSAPSSVYQINTLGIGDASVVSLALANSTAVTDALAAGGSTSTNWSVTNAPVLQSSSSSTTQTGQSSSSSTANGYDYFLQTGGSLTGVAKLGHIFTGVYDNGSVNYWTGNGDPNALGYSLLGGPGNSWYYNSASVVSDVTTVTTTTSYQTTTVYTYGSRVDNYDQSYGSAFVILDADTGAVLGTAPASGWDALIKGDVYNAAGQAGVVKSKFSAQGVASTTSTYTSFATNVANSQVTARSAGASTGNWYVYDPIVVDFASQPSFLAGSEAWRLNAVNRPPVLHAMRSINLDGKGVKMWEWLGPKEGILVWNPSQDANFTPKPSDFLGNNAFGKSFKDGYAALSTLADSNGLVTGANLKNIWVWVDSNGDGVIQPGEFVPLISKGVTSLSVRPENDKGGLYAKANLENGKTLVTRDWWSVGGIDANEFKSFVNDILKTPSIYNWKVDKSPNKGGLSKEVKPLSKEELLSIPGGTLRFYPEKEGIFGLSAVKGLVTPDGHIPALRFLVKSTKFGSYAWTVDFGDGKTLETQVYSRGDMLRGATVVHTKEGYSSGYTWTAKRKSGPSFDLLAQAWLAHKAP
jgi:type II secretory pathway pseudopilin PulG